jgi:hypothetical protein
MSLTKSEVENIREMLINIQLALSSSHNTITTDDIDAQPDETHWRINHNQQIQQIDEIAKLLNINLCSDPRCSCGNSDL